MRLTDGLIVEVDSRSDKDKDLAEDVDNKIHVVDVALHISLP